MVELTGNEIQQLLQERINSYEKTIHIQLKYASKYNILDDGYFYHMAEVSKERIKMKELQSVLQEIIDKQKRRQSNDDCRTNS